MKIESYQPAWQFKQHYIYGSELPPFLWFSKVRPEKGSNFKHDYLMKEQVSDNFQYMFEILKQFTKHVRPKILGFCTSYMLQWSLKSFHFRLLDDVIRWQ
jgi:hypothetical protein